MGNFEKLSVLVIGVIIVMILVVALYTWTDDPAGQTADIERSSQEPTLLSEQPESQSPSSGGWPDWTPAVAPEPVRSDDTILSDPQTPAAGDPETVEPAEPAAPAASSGNEPAAAERTVTVKEGETLSHIAQRELGKASRWKLIADRNDIANPANVRAGTVLVIPAVDRETTASGGASVASAPASRGPVKPGAEYTVKGGDTIQKISQAAFGTIERWTDIWFANLERIEDPRFLRAGTTLQIPN